MTNIMAEQQESTREPGIDRQRVAGEVEEQREHIKASNGPEDEKNGHKRPLSGRARHHLLSAICGARIARQGTGRKGEMCLRSAAEGVIFANHLFGVTVKFVSGDDEVALIGFADRKSTRLNSSH